MSSYDQVEREAFAEREVELEDAQRVERAYRLAWPDEHFDEMNPDEDGATPEMAWIDALVCQEGGNVEPSLAHAILALALLPEGGGTLGRWTARPALTHLPRYRFSRDDTWAFRRVGSWSHVLAPGAYLDGTAQELLLLMAAADELARREVQNG